MRRTGQGAAAGRAGRLSPTERVVIDLRRGLNGYAVYSLEETARILRLRPAKVKEIEARAAEKLAQQDAVAADAASGEGGTANDDTTTH
jgi:DNA-directed RNA polymerase sigma subunit (sigma70/sigma32)